MGENDLLHNFGSNGPEDIFSDLQKHFNIVSAVSFRSKHRQKHPSFCIFIDIFFPHGDQSIHVPVAVKPALIFFLLNHTKCTK